MKACRPASPRAVFEKNLFHGSGSLFDSFSAARIPRWAPGKIAGIYLSSDRAAAEEYGRHLYEVKVTMANPYIGCPNALLRAHLDQPAPGFGKPAEAYQKDAALVNPASIKQHLLDLGHDGALIPSGAAYLDHDEVIAFDPSQLEIVSLNGVVVGSARDLDAADASLAQAATDYADHADALSETGFWGRRAAGCLVYSTHTDRLLVQLRSERVLEPQTWGTWGGAIDSDETPLRAVYREMEEEGLFADRIEKAIPVYVFTHPSGFTYHNFIMVTDREFEPSLDLDEGDDFAWVSLDEIFDLPGALHPGLKAMLGSSVTLDALSALRSQYQSAPYFVSGNQQP